MKRASGLEVIYEDDHIIAVNKPPRMASVPSRHIGEGSTVLGRVRRRTANMGIYALHRLDYATSGVLLFGKNPAERSILEKIPRASTTKKRYVALVLGEPRGHQIDFPLPSRITGEKIPATTLFFIKEKFHLPPCTLVEAEIKTGRQHQIRRHFAGIGNPVVLDDRYGDRRFNRLFRIRLRLGRQFLHSEILTFEHPILQKTITITAQLPLDLQSVMKKLHSVR